MLGQLINANLPPHIELILAYAYLDNKQSLLGVATCLGTKLNRLPLSLAEAMIASQDENLLELINKLFKDYSISSNIFAEKTWKHLTKIISQTGY
ncbi:MAG: hypothetical protein IT292_07700 [Deltaproteobacteria bacterium]|nr:hypothetical protein [Deltaproteobacteria bacterium]